jgi:hypothetical protein
MGRVIQAAARFGWDKEVGREEVCVFAAIAESMRIDMVSSSSERMGEWEKMDGRACVEGVLHAKAVPDSDFWRQMRVYGFDEVRDARDICDEFDGDDIPGSVYACVSACGSGEGYLV